MVQGPGTGLNSSTAAVTLDLDFWSQSISYSVSYFFPDLKFNCGLFRPFLASRDWNILHRFKTTQAWQCPEPVSVEPCSEVSQTINGNVGKEYIKSSVLSVSLCSLSLICMPFLCVLHGVIWHPVYSTWKFNPCACRIRQVVLH